MRITREALDAAIGDLHGVLGTTSLSDALLSLGHELEGVSESQLVAWAAMVGSDLYAIVGEQGNDRQTSLATVLLEGLLLGLALPADRR